MILVVDDDRSLTESIREFLEDEGYEVRTARDGAEAYRHVRDPKCKGLVLDFHMPGINGVELLMLMMAEGCTTPVLLMTSDPNFEELEMKQFPNVRKLLRKPLVPEELQAAVRQYIERPAASRP